MRAFRFLSCLGVLSLAILISTGGAAAQQSGATVQARVTQDQATVGDRIGFEITVRTPPGWTASVPDLPLRVGDLDLVERLSDQVSLDGTERRYRYVLSPFYVGELWVPPVKVTYRATDGTEGFVYTDALPIQVVSVIPAGDPGDTVHDLLPQAELSGEPFVFPREFAISAGVVAFALLALLFIVRRLLRSAGQRRVLRPVLANAEDLARAALDQLSAGGVPTRRTLKPYYGTLAQVVRRYLTERYAFPAVALTTSEMEERMARAGLDRWQARLVNGLLAECDSVHYAQYIPAQQRADHDLSLAYEIIEVISRPADMGDGEPVAVPAGGSDAATESAEEQAE